MKKYIIILIILILANAWLFLLEDIPEKWQDFISSVENDFKGKQTLEKLVSIDPPRLSGTKGGRRAEDFVINYFKEIGFDKVMTDSFSHPGWERVSCELRILSDKIDTIRALSMGLSPVAENLTGHIVFCEQGFPDHFEEKNNLDGAIALIDMSVKTGIRFMHFAEKLENAYQHGIKGAIFFNQYMGDFISISTVSLNSGAKIPAVSISREDGEKIKDIIQKNPDTKAVMNVENRIFEAHARNIYVDIPGEYDSNDLVLVGAHLDAWDIGHAALDNGVSDATLLEIARQLKLTNFVPGRTIRLVMFMGEELGWHGSAAYITKHKDELKDIFYFLNLEQVYKPTGINLLIKNKNKVWFDSLSTEMRDLGVSQKSFYKPWFFSDHATFMLVGVPTLEMSSNIIEFVRRVYHSEIDHVDLIKADVIKNNVKIVGILIQEMSRAKNLEKYSYTEEEVVELLSKDFDEDYILNIKKSILKR